MQEFSIKTERLILRPWRESDFEAFAELNADQRVMEYFPAVLSRAESDQLAHRICQGIEKDGFGLWAVSIRGGADFIGFIGLSPVNMVASFTPAVEIGWRLAAPYWGQGYATEGAKAALKYAFETLHLDDIVAFTAVHNSRSRGVMQKIGMDHDAEHDFDHPKLPEGHPLRRHVLYRIRAGHFTEVWEKEPEHFHPKVEVAACYIEVDGRILLLQRANSQPEGKTWGVPAGKMEAGETPLAAALRELWEETGIKALPSEVQPVGKLFVQKPRGAFVYHMFQVHLNHEPTVLLSAEHTRYLFADSREIDNLHLIGGGKVALNYFLEKKKPKPLDL